MGYGGDLEKGHWPCPSRPALDTSSPSPVQRSESVSLFELLKCDPPRHFGFPLMTRALVSGWRMAPGAEGCFSGPAPAHPPSRLSSRRRRGPRLGRPLAPFKVPEVSRTPRHGPDARGTDFLPLLRFTAHPSPQHGHIRRHSPPPFFLCGNQAPLAFSGAPEERQLSRAVILVAPTPQSRVGAGLSCGCQWCTPINTRPCPGAPSPESAHHLATGHSLG